MRQWVGGLFPAFLRARLRKPLLSECTCDACALDSLAQAQNPEQELGLYILEKTKDFARRRGGDAEALQSAKVADCIFRQKCLSEMNEAHQYLQTALMPHYERNLYEYYRQQQYCMLLTFLSYAFRGPGCLDSHVQPYITASSKLPKLRILDYGAGLAFGPIQLMRLCPEKVESVSIVDLDLIHTYLVEHILSGMASNAAVSFLRVTNPDRVPDLDGRTFNMIYGKDIFEHLHEPERHLRAMLARAEGSCVCYFDFSDHGAKYLQHVHPQLSHLRQVLSDLSFRPTGCVGGLSEFARNV